MSTSSDWYDPYSVRQHPSFAIDDPLVIKTFTTARAKRRLTSPYREGSTEILPGLFSTDPDVLRFKKALGTELTEAFYDPDNVDSQGRLKGNGVRSNFMGLNYVSGFGQNPSTWPIVDNAQLRRDMGLKNEGLDPKTVFIIKAVFLNMVKDLEPQPLRFRKGTSTMWPFYSQDNAFKKELASHVLSNYKRIGASWRKGDFETPFRELHVAPITDAVYRLQSNDGISDDGSVPKERPVADLAYALSGGKKGNRNPSDRTFKGHELENDLRGFFRQRRRTAFGMSAGINYILALVAQSIRESIYRRYPLTYHLRTREELQEHVRGCVDVAAVDVAQHDQLWPMFLRDIGRDIFLDLGFDEDWVSIYYYSGFSSIFTTGVGSNEPNMLLGDWRKPSIRMGLSSGTAFTDLDGSWLMTATYAEMMLKYVTPSIYQQITNQEKANAIIDDFLNWKLPVAIKDKSDDALICLLDNRYKEGFDNLLRLLEDGEPVSDLMKIELEHGSGYLGSMIIFPEDSATKEIIVTGNPISYVINQFSPEYGVQSQVRDRTRTRRPYPGLAWKSYPEVYGSIPIIGEMNDIIEKQFYDIFGYSYPLYRQKMLDDDLRRLAIDMKGQNITLDSSSLSFEELDIIQSPDRADWKYSKDDYRPQILDLAFRGLPLEEVEPVFSNIVPQGVL